MSEQPPRQLLQRIWSRLPRVRSVFFFTIGLCAVTSIVALSVFLYILIVDAIPIHRAYHLELAYLYALDHADLTNILYQSSPDTKIPPPPGVQGLIRGVPQLNYWSIPGACEYGSALGIDFDGLGWSSRKEAEIWIYFGGTAATPTEPETLSEDSEVARDPTIFQHRYKTHTCVDPAPICDMYNSAFERVSARFEALKRSVPGTMQRRRTFLRYADCDVSPLICGANWGFDIQAVMLVQLRIGNDCLWTSLGISQCPVTWRFFELPLWHLPWTRQIRIPLDRGGSTVVPAFPDAEEQLWTLLSQEYSELGLEYFPETQVPKANNVIIRVKPDPSGPPIYSTKHVLGIEHWGTLRELWDTRLGWQNEEMIRCYVLRWMDSFLRWWDGPPYAVKPRSCVRDQAEEVKIKKLIEARDRLEAKYPDVGYVFVER
ncbi:hypothetical protein B0J11DRAFT_542579 [Dendryphion nanum]|uniref:Uncharacterized protein n=1 Tax=Dendryphion nanum TaxID=256645 RepID=A0A9P9IAH9_9PLEO|nr:hypothetical protein B0J11DRAFT_542579 [Dendryphion nanum]